MVSFLFLILGSIDILGGVGIVFASQLVLAGIAKYIGIALILKGIWSMATSLM